MANPTYVLDSPQGLTCGDRRNQRVATDRLPRGVRACRYGPESPTTPPANQTTPGPRGRGTEPDRPPGQYHRGQRRAGPPLTGWEGDKGDTPGRDTGYYVYGSVA